jgi:hypothetical protein
MRALAAGLLALACCVPAAAQQRSDEKTPEQRCLQHEAGPQAEPAYPAAAYNANLGGRVQVVLRFAGPDARPSVQVLLHEGDEEFLGAVRAHLRGLRVPCMSPSGPAVEFRQEYAFVPDQRRVHWSEPRDQRIAGGARVWSCLVHGSGFRAPAYPAWALRDEVQGRVVLRLRFDKPDAPPGVDVFSRPSTRRLALQLASWAEDYRLPCLDQPSSTLFTYVYTINQNRYGFREISFRQVLGGARGIRQQTLAFDTTQMGCPFDLRVHYLRPQLANNVGEPGEPVPARRPLIEWLEGFEFDLPDDALDAAWGDTFKVTVPCIRINFKPKEKS